VVFVLFVFVLCLVSNIVTYVSALSILDCPKCTESMVISTWWCIRFNETITNNINWFPVIKLENTTIWKQKINL
jgi:hypothetical protein